MHAIVVAAVILLAASCSCCCCWRCCHGLGISLKCLGLRRGDAKKGHLLGYWAFFDVLFLLLLYFGDKGGWTWIVIIIASVYSLVTPFCEYLLDEYGQDLIMYYLRTRQFATKEHPNNPKDGATGVGTTRKDVTRNYPDPNYPQGRPCTIREHCSWRKPSLLV